MRHALAGNLSRLLMFTFKKMFEGIRVMAASIYSYYTHILLFIILLF